MAAEDATRGAPLVGIVAGEASGDALAATLIRAVRSRNPRVRFAGIAGPKMQAEGCEAWFPMERLAVRGFVPPAVLRAQETASIPPDDLEEIDSSACAGCHEESQEGSTIAADAISTAATMP